MRGDKQTEMEKGRKKETERVREFKADWDTFPASCGCE